MGKVKVLCALGGAASPALFCLRQRGLERNLLNGWCFHLCPEVNCISSSLLIQNNQRLVISLFPFPSHHYDIYMCILSITITREGRVIEGSQ